MEPQPLGIRYRHYFDELTRLARAENRITESNIYQEANTSILKIVDTMLRENMLEGSRLEGLDNFTDFLNKVKEGKRGLLLMEHYSNFDLPGLHYLLRKDGGETGKEIADRLVAIAGMKLNEENPIVSAWAEAYSRINIYPSRTLASITDPAEHEKEEQKSRKINMASMRALDKARKEGKIILVFPSGTRYRPGHPETRKGVREIDSYLRLSDVMVLVSINGNCLRISEDNPSDMMHDIVCQDKVIMAAGPVIECKPFRQHILDTTDDSVGDKKQVVVDKIMDMLLEQHEQYEAKRFADAEN